MKPGHRPITAEIFFSSPSRVVATQSSSQIFSEQSDSTPIAHVRRELEQWSWQSDSVRGGPSTQTWSSQFIPGAQSVEGKDPHMCTPPTRTHHTTHYMHTNMHACTNTHAHIHNK